jgi:hypothetical protein
MSDDIPPASNPALGIETETVSEDEQESQESQESQGRTPTVEPTEPSQELSNESTMSSAWPSPTLNPVLIAMICLLRALPAGINVRIFKRSKCSL